MEKIIKDNRLIKFINLFRKYFYGDIGQDYDQMSANIYNNTNIDEPVILNSFNVWTLDELVKVLENLDNSEELCLNIERGNLFIANYPQHINVLETEKVLGHIRWNVIGKGLRYLTDLKHQGYELVFDYASTGTSGLEEDFGINFQVMKDSKEVGHVYVYKGVIHEMSAEVEKILGITK
jgi:hypothetical protein